MGPKVGKVSTLQGLKPSTFGAAGGTAKQAAEKLIGGRKKRQGTTFETKSRKIFQNQQIQWVENRQIPELRDNSGQSCPVGTPLQGMNITISPAMGCRKKFLKLGLNPCGAPYPLLEKILLKLTKPV
jgi:hypothetical protein